MECGTPSTLKRNGSDYSGSLFANFLKAKLYTVWTDTDGVYTADPRKVLNAVRLPFLSYVEAVELAYFGAKVLHPMTMEPCIALGIPIIIKSSIKPDSKGTIIASSIPAALLSSVNEASRSTKANAIQTEPDYIIQRSLSSSSIDNLTRIAKEDDQKMASGKVV